MCVFEGSCRCRGIVIIVVVAVDSHVDYSSRLTPSFLFIKKRLRYLSLLEPPRGARKKSNLGFVFNNSAEPGI